jgi:hypothetical protein
VTQTVSSTVSTITSNIAVAASTDAAGDLSILLSPALLEALLNVAQSAPAACGAKRLGRREAVCYIADRVAQAVNEIVKNPQLMDELASVEEAIVQAQSGAEAAAEIEAGLEQAAHAVSLIGEEAETLVSEVLESALIVDDGPATAAAVAIGTTGLSLLALCLTVFAANGAIPQVVAVPASNVVTVGRPSTSITLSTTSQTSTSTSSSATGCPTAVTNWVSRGNTQAIALYIHGTVLIRL